MTPSNAISYEIETTMASTATASTRSQLFIQLPPTWTGRLWRIVDLAKGDSTTSAFANVEESLESAEDGERGVDDNCAEDGTGNRSAMLDFFGLLRTHDNVAIVLDAG
jgi:hypothetical protein